MNYRVFRSDVYYYYILGYVYVPKSLEFRLYLKNLGYTTP